MTPDAVAIAPASTGAVAISAASDRDLAQVTVFDSTEHLRALHRSAVREGPG
jgi:hypothetical protein